MIYDEHDIDFALITPLEFENLCYEILPYFGFSSITWRQGGADMGRDMEAKLLFNSTFISDHYTKWFFECKHYRNGVPPEDLHSKIAWADAQQPDFLCILVSSYITTGAREWLKDMQRQKFYKIIVFEGVELKRKLITIQNLIPKYFSKDKYMKLYDEIKRHNLLYKISPSYEVLETIIGNVPMEKFELNDIGFLLKSFYGNYEKMEAENEITDSFNKNLTDKLIPRLRELSNQINIAELVYNSGFLGGSGFIDKSEIAEYTNLTFQTYSLHLNYHEDEEHWDLGTYIIVIVDKKNAFELFFSQKTQLETYAYYYDNYNEQVLTQILSTLHSEEVIEEVKKYSKAIL